MKATVCRGLGYGDMEIWRYGGYRGQLDVSFLFSPSLLFLLELGPVQMATARVLPPTTGGGLSLYAGSTERSPSSGTDRQRDLRERTRAYELGFFLLLLFMYGYAAQEVCR